MDDATVHTAIHEAGHAVARVLSIGTVGITEDNAIRWITVERGVAHCSVFMLPTGRPGLKEAAERIGIIGEPHTPEQWLTVLRLMDIDPQEWARVRLFELAAGAAAEAKFNGLPFDMVWYGTQCSDDRTKSSETCKMIGLQEAESRSLIAQQSRKARTELARPDIWRAVLILAEQLPSGDRMPGKDAIAIIQKALNGE